MSKVSEFRRSRGEPASPEKSEVRTAKSGIGTFSGFCLLVSVFCLLPAASVAADISARRMEIVQTPDGQETVFRDSVTIVDGGTTIRAQLARFNERRGVATVSDSVFIQSPDALIRADSAVYLLEAGAMELFGGVQVEIESLFITAPRLLYLVGEQRVDAEYGLTLRTGREGTQLQGARGRYYVADRVGEVDSLPSVLMAVSAEDSVTAVSRSMTWFGDDESALLSGDVKVGGRASVLTADSLRFWTRSDTGFAWGGPRVTVPEGGTEGDTVRLYVQDGALRSLEVAGRARGRYATARSGDIEVAGQAIRIRLERGELERVEVESMTHGRLVRQGGAAAAGERD